MTRLLSKQIGDVRLQNIDPSSPTREVVLERFPIRLGRNADIAVEDRWLSRHHCEIQWQDGQLTVRDLQSKHGTYVNGSAIDTAQLQSGDEIRVGMSRFVVHY